MRAIFDRVILAVAAVSTTALVLIATGVVDAGPLDPPGPVGSTMKTLDQIEARTPISQPAAFPIVIDQPGSYYLTEDIQGVVDTEGIVVSVNSGEVSIDLNGFTMRGANQTGTGIQTVGDTARLHLKNGTLTNWRAAIAVENAIVEAIVAADNDFRGLVMTNSVARDCVVTGTTTTSIVIVDSVLERCHVNGGGLLGIDGSGSVIRAVTVVNALTGIAVVDSLIDGANVTSSGDDGIVVSDASTVMNSAVRDSGNDGIELLFNSSAINNTVYNNGRLVDGSGIWVQGTGNHVEGNASTKQSFQDAGISTGSAGNVFIRNTSIGHGAANYNIAASALTSGPIVGADAAAPSPLANVSE